MKQEIQDGGSKMAAVFRNLDVIPKLSEVTRACYGRQRKQFWTYYTFVLKALVLLELSRRGHFVLSILLKELLNRVNNWCNNVQDSRHFGIMTYFLHHVTPSESASQCSKETILGV